MKNKKVKQILLEKIKKNQLPLFYSNPIFSKTDTDDPSILFLKEIEVNDYKTNHYQIADSKIVRPICKSFKL